jgi:alkanesulfonate monooxygenase SsuD/methylene tetrahydromethanopterin reductase-like flavin-dependent oxidoreductase (luciferase family)
MVDAAQTAEDLGFDAVVAPDHYVFEALGTLQTEAPAYELFFVLATIAQRTTRLELVSHVACMLFRHPAMHARLFAQIDEASGGRVVAGVGAGWTRAEFEMMHDFRHLRTPAADGRGGAAMRALGAEPSITQEATASPTPCLPRPLSRIRR